MTLTHRFMPGDRVRVAGIIDAVVEELIFARGMVTPLLAVEYWHEGRIISCRVHEADAEAQS